MRVTLGTAAAVALAMVACASCSNSQSSQVAAAAEPETELVTAVGCPMAGPQPGCVTIRSRGKVYDLAMAAPAVDMSKGVGVSLTGHTAGDATACGQKLTDIKLEYLSLQCGPATPPA